MRIYYGNSYYGTSSYLNYLRIAAIVTLIVAFVAAILLCIFIVPSRRREKLGSFGKLLHDLFNFKGLLIEKILKFTYIFSTLYIIIIGFLAIFDFDGGEYVGWVGILYMILGPIAIRLVYEFLIMFILLVRNVIDIRNRLYDNSQKPMKKQDAMAEKPYNGDNYRYDNTARQMNPPDIGFCIYCGTRYDKANGPCPNPDCPSNKAN